MKPRKITYEQLPEQTSDYVPTDEEVERARKLHEEFLDLSVQINDLFERQVRILYEFYQHPQLCIAEGYENIAEFLRDPVNQEAMRIKVGSRSQFYRLLDLAEVDARFPNQHILREPHLAKITHTAAIKRLRQLEPGEEEKAEEILEEVRNSNTQKLDAELVYDVLIDGNTIKIDGKPVLRVKRFTTLAIRAISKIAHFSPAPQFVLNDRYVVGWHNGRPEDLFELLTRDSDLLELIRDRLQATRS